MASIKSELTELIWSRGQLTLNELESWCHTHRIKLATAERKLRKSESPTIKAIQRNGAIIGYEPNRIKIEMPEAFKDKVEKPSNSLF